MSEPALFIRLYLDADVDVKLAIHLRGAGYDCVSAREMNHHTLDDEAILAFAAGEGRTLFTHNTQDFVPIFRRWWHAERPHAGIIVSQQLPLGELQNRTLSLLNSVTAEEMSSNIVNLAEFAARD
jgi:predicted nuclease of predicted toxin-antitoxin system